MNRWILAFLIFPLLVAILPVKSPCTLSIIARGAPLLFLVVAGHGGCCQIFGILDNKLIDHPFWKLVCGLLGWVPTRAVSLWPTVFWIWPFLPHLWQVISYLVDDTLPDSLPFTLRQILKSTCFKALLIGCSITTVNDFGSEVWSWDFSFLVAGSHRFESTRSRYYCVASCTRDS